MEKLESEVEEGKTDGMENRVEILRERDEIRKNGRRKEKF